MDGLGWMDGMDGGKGARPRRLRPVRLDLRGRGRV